MARSPAVQEIEVPPEADRLDEAPHPRATRVLYGHATAEATMLAAFQGGRMHHGWLISGVDGVGKATLAYRFARFALAAPSERDPFGQSLDVAPDTIASRQILALSHPNLLVIRRVWDPKLKRFTTTIPVDDVRRIKSFLAHSADEGTYRVVIVDTADELNPNAANALLKSLEEPPARTFILLLTSEPGRLLPTIRSRCRTLDLAPLSETDLRRAVHGVFQSLDREPPGASDWTRLVALSDGSVRRALTLWLGDGLKLEERITAFLDAMPAIDWGGAHTLADELASAASAERFEMFYDLLLARLARLVRAAAGGQSGAADQALAKRLIRDGRLATWAELWETVVREKGEAQALNLDRKSLILDTFHRIGSAASA